MPDFKAIRERFPIFKTRTYLNSCGQGALSLDVQSGISEFVSSWDAAGSPWAAWTAKYEELRQQFAAFIGAQSREVAIVSCATQAVSVIASCLDYRDRPRVVMGELEFPTMGHAWLAQRARGAQIDFLPAEKDAMPLARYAEAVDHRTAVVPVTGVSYMNGFRSDVRGIADIAHAQGAWVMLDDYQDCGTRAVDVKALDVDFYIAGTVKYLLGTSGLAFLYVRESLIPQLSPTYSGWFAQARPFDFDLMRLDLAADSRRFEAGTPAMIAVYAALPALRLLSEAAPSNIASHVRVLARTLMSGIERLGLVAKTPPDTVGPLVVVRAHDAEALVAAMAQQGIIVSHRADGVRIALHLYNSVDDVQEVLHQFDRLRALLVTCESGRSGAEHARSAREQA